MISLFITLGLKSSDVSLCIDRQCHLCWKVTISLPCICFSAFYLKKKMKLSNILTPLLFCHVCSILVRTTEWESIRANMPWLLDAIGCVALDLFVSFIRSFFMQIFFVNNKLFLFYFSRTYSSNIFSQDYKVVKP